MKFLLVGRQLTTRDYCRTIDAETVAEAFEKFEPVKKLEGHLEFIPQVIVNLDTSEALRVVRNGGGTPSFKAVDTAYDVVGIETPDEYFSEPQ